MLPLVFLPGLLSDKRVWEHQVKYLGGYYPMHIIELFSANTPDTLVEKVLAQAPEHFTLVGHSMGGWLALEIMKEAPERVKKLCLINTTARPDSETKKNARLQMLNLVEHNQFEKVITSLANAMVFKQEVYKQVKSMMKKVGKDIFVAQEQAMLIREDCRQILSHIKCPTLVVHSSEDKVFTLDDHLELANQIALAKLAIIDESGHMTPLEQPQAITTLLRFWLQNF